MTDALDDLLFERAGSESKMQKMRAALEQDPALARAFHHWQAAQSALRERLNERVPDRSLLVLYALSEEQIGDVEELAPAEQERLASARDELEAALEAHPALKDVVRQIQRERAAFERIWEEQFGESGTRTSVPVGPLDRDVHKRARRPPRRSSARRWVWRLSVGAAVIAFCVVLFFVLQRDHNMITAETGAGEMRTIALGEGSSVLLDEQSRFTYVDPETQTALSNQARLEGRAFFDLAPDRQGYSVETPTARATVLGTRFAVHADPEETEVVLAEGRLSLAPAGAHDQGVVLEEGQQSRVARNARPTTPRPADVTEALAWTGQLVFADTPVADVATRLHERYDVAVRVAPALREERVTGTFDREQSVEEVLQVLAAALGAEVREEEDSYVLAP